jgi:hypothetical protein
MPRWPVRLGQHIINDIQASWLEECECFVEMVILPGPGVSKNIEAVSKLKKCQEKCDFHGDKKAVADEIRAALRWRACPANPISPI